MGSRAAANDPNSWPARAVGRHETLDLRGGTSQLTGGRPTSSGGGGDRTIGTSRQLGVRCNVLRSDIATAKDTCEKARTVDTDE